MNHRVSLIVPCYQRPQRTIRAIDSILAQDMDAWEAFIVGDGCPFIQQLIDEDTDVFMYKNSASRFGSKIHFINNYPNMGGWGYHARNQAIDLCTGDYVMFLDNDDCILPNHFSNYYGGIKDTDNDFMYYDVWLNPIENRSGVQGRIREAKLIEGNIGHAELIIKSSVIRSMPRETPNYHHDWELVKNMIDAGCKSQKGVHMYPYPTYVMVGVGELREKNID